MLGLPRARCHGESNNNGAPANDGVRAVLELMMGQGVYALCLVLIDVGVTFERLDVKVAVVGVF